MNNLLDSISDIWFQEKDSGIKVLLYIYGVWELLPKMSRVGWPMIMMDHQQYQTTTITIKRNN